MKKINTELLCPQCRKFTCEEISTVCLLDNDEISVTMIRCKNENLHDYCHYMIVENTRSKVWNRYIKDIS